MFYYRKTDKNKISNGMFRDFDFKDKVRNPFLNRRILHLAIGGVLILFLLVIYLATVAPPRDFPTGEIITVEEGSGLLEVAGKLKEDNAIRSTFWFRIAAIVLKGERTMRAGDYYLPEPQNALTIAWRVVRGDHALERVRITIPEGFNVKKISALFTEDKFIFFDNKEFEMLAPEGYLFPDTYFIQINATATSTIRLLRDNFIRKIFPVMPEIEKSGRTLEEVITMASIIENEANTQEDREIISGILWKRIQMGMPLQVDAAFAYVNGKTTAELTTEDLAISSPYNTYVNRGLPPTPISNPGLESIYAAVHPTTTPYLYFLTGDDGKMYYSKTHDEHVEKKQKYLRN